MLSKPRSNLVSARVIAGGACGALCALMVAPPILARHGCYVAAIACYFFFSCICHQRPERTFRLLGYPLAVCHRCSGIYLGLLMGSLFENPWIHRSPKARRYWILAASVPLAFDALAPFSGLWTNTSGTRFVTGLVFGIVTSSLLVQGIAELFTEAPWRRFALGDSNLRGGHS
jgi:uncharacterized membrane protein